ncbi:LacI family DNA-binding transcriptional regulator [Nocardioides marmoraquaticus]
MADVAAVAGVSHQTVSRVLNDHPLVKDETRERVRAAMQQLGYRRNAAARALVTDRSNRIGVVAAHLALHGPSMINAAVQEAAHTEGYSVELVGVRELTPEALQGSVERLLDQAVEALVVAVAHRDSMEVVRALDLPVPLVTVQGVRAGQAMAVGIDQHHGGELATRHLLEVVGERGRVAHLAGPSDWTEAEMRREGWRAAIDDARADPGRVLEGDWSAASGYEAGRELLADPDVAGIFVANDDMALGLLRAVHEAGRRTPHHVAVVGFDDQPVARFYWPPLSSVRQDFAALGTRAVDLALRALAGERDASADLVVPELVVRASSSPD